MVAEAGAEFGVEFRERLHRGAGDLCGGHGDAAATGRAATGRGREMVFADGREQRVAHRGAVGIGGGAVRDFDDAGPALVHDGHVRRDDGVAEAAEFFDVLFVDDALELRLGDAEGLEERGDAEEGAEEGIPLHAELELGLVRGFAGDVEAGQNEDADLVFLDEAAVFRGDALPGDLGRVARFPDEGAAFFQAVEGIGVGEGFRVAAEDDVDVVELAVHLDALGGDGEVVIGGRALFLGAVFRVGHHVDLFHEFAGGVVGGIRFGNELAEVADDGAEVFARGDHAPAADGVEADGNGFVGEEGGRVFADDGVGVVGAEDEERLAVGGGAAVFAGGGAGGEFVGAEGMLGAEIAGADAVTAAEEARRLGGREGGQRGAEAKFGGFGRFAEGAADFASEGIVAGHALVGALEDDDVFLAAEGCDDGGFGEGADDVDVDGADLGVALFAEVVAGGLDVVGGAAEGDEDGVGVGGFVVREEAVGAAGEAGELGVGRGEHRKDGLVEIIPAGDDAVHVVFLVLDGPEEDRVLEVHHLRDAAAPGAEEFALGGRGAIDLVVDGAEEFAEEGGLGGEIHALAVGGEHAVLDVHAGVERELGDAAEKDGLVGGLLGVAGHEHGPAGVEGGVEIVVGAVDVEGVLGQGAGADLEDHRREFAGRVVILLHGVDDALAGGEVDGAAAGDGVGGGAALGGVFALGFDGDFLVAPDVQLPLREGLLIDLAALGGRRDRVKYAALGDARLDVLGDEVIAVAGDAEAGVFRLRGGRGGGGGRLRRRGGLTVGGMAHGRCEEERSFLRRKAVGGPEGDSAGELRDGRFRAGFKGKTLAMTAAGDGCTGGGR